MMELALQDGRVTRISDVDYERCRQHKWSVTEANASGKPYVRTFVGKITVYLHRLITDCPDIYKVDHRDNDGLNNQRPNLRIATHNQNNYNRQSWGLSEFKGVCKDGRRWKARITLNGECHHLGMYDDQVLAAKAYDAEAHQLFKEFAWLNFPEDYPLPDFDIPELHPERFQIPF